MFTHIRFLLLALSFLITANASTSTSPSNTKFTIPTLPNLHPSKAELISSSSGLDAPKVAPINATSFDWWYFDAVSLDSNASIVVTFFTATEGGFALLIGQIEVDSVMVSASFPNGTLVSVTLPATEAVVEVAGEGSSGVWSGTGLSWEGTTDLSRYVVTLDVPVLGIKGTVIFESIAPAHYPCGPVEDGQNMQVGPHIGWSNAIPDAITTVNVSFGLSRLEFIGMGYHDKNWGDQPVIENVGRWLWGHGRLGPYSIVWFDLVHPNGTEYLSAYATQNGTIVSSRCDGITVRSITNSEFFLSENLRGYHIGLDLGNQGVLGVNVTNIFVTLQAGDIYTRSLGRLEGQLNEDSWRGVSLQDELNFVK